MAERSVVYSVRWIIYVGLKPYRRHSELVIIAAIQGSQVLRSYRVLAWSWLFWGALPVIVRSFFHARLYFQLEDLAL